MIYTSKDIYVKAMETLDNYGDSSMIRTAQNMGINVLYRDYKKLVGMCVIMLGNPFIFLKNGINEFLEAMAAGHEIGHIVLHPELCSGDGIREFTLFDMKTCTEYEANAFASHLLIPNDDVISDFKNGYDIATVAKMNNVNINMMLIKLQEMQQLGYNINAPMLGNPAFLAGLDN